MGSRGRTSRAELEIHTLAGNTVLVTRPDAPHDLNDEQAEEWRSIVNRLPADWFPRETWGLLAQYCRHLVSARRVQQLVASVEADQEFDIVAYDRALKMQERESRCLASLATKMRMSQQTQYDKSKKRGSVVSRRPWE